MPPRGRHPSRYGRAAHGSGDPGAAWPRPTAGVGVVALGPRAWARGGGWDRTCRPCPRAYLRLRRDHRRGIPLRARCSSRPSTVLRPPRTPAAQRSLSPSAYTSHLAATTATQTGLPCSAPLLERVLLPLPRGDPTRVRFRFGARRTWPSPWHARLGWRPPCEWPHSPIV